MPVVLPAAKPVAVPPDLSLPIQGALQINSAAGAFGVKRYLLTEGASRDVELLAVVTDRVQALICPTRGMSLWKARIDGLDLGWRSPVQGPIHPNYVAVEESSGIGWLDGFDELLVRCGLRSFGAPDFDENGNLLFPLHGKVGNLPARNLSVSVDEQHSLLTVEAEVHETRFLQYNLRLTARYVFAYGEPSIEIHDRVTNAGATPTTGQMLYHINVGSPLLEAGAELVMDAERIVARNEHAASAMGDWATYAEPTAGFEEQVYFFSGKPTADGNASALLKSKDGQRGFAVHWHTKTLPYFSQWKNTVARQDGYVTGLEPGTGFPNPRSFEEEKGRLVELAGGESVEFDLRLEALAEAGSVARLADEISARNQSQPAAIEYDADWCVPR